MKQIDMSSRELPPTETDQQQASSPRNSEQEEQAWLLALAQWLQQQVLPPPRPAPTVRQKMEHGTTAEGFEENSTEDLGDPGATQGAAHADATVPKGNAASAPRAPDRLQVRLSAGHLGPLEVSVVRRAKSLDVVIVVARSRVKRLIERQRAELDKSLAWLNLPIFLRIAVHTNQPGTALASSEGKDRRVQPSPLAKPNFEQHQDRTAVACDPHVSPRSCRDYEPEHPNPLLNLIV